MKRIIAIALLACMTMFCGACSDSSTKEESSGKVSIESQDNSNDSSVSEESSKEESSKEESSKEESSKEESSKKEKTVLESSAEQSSKEEESSAAVTSVEESSEKESSIEESSVVSEEPESSVESEVIAPSEQEVSSVNEQPQAAQPVMGQFSADDMGFTYNNYTVSLHDNMQNVIASIGNASSVETAPSCLAINIADDKMYYYDGFMIQTYTDNEAEKVYMIQITGTSAATTKGITIGSTASDIENAYGLDSAAEHSDFMYSYNADNKTHLDFIMESGKVIEIDYTYDVV